MPTRDDSGVEARFDILCPYGQAGLRHRHTSFFWDEIEEAIAVCRNVATRDQLGLACDAKEGPIVTVEERIGRDEIAGGP